MAHIPFNRHFWIILGVVVFVAGLLFGQAAGLNDALDAASASVGAQGKFLRERMYMRQVEVELLQLDAPVDESDFGEVDAALREL